MERSKVRGALLVPYKELERLLGLKPDSVRGVYAKEDIEALRIIHDDAEYYALEVQDTGTLPSMFIAELRKRQAQD